MNKLIVLVEDDADIREVIRDTLCEKYIISAYEDGLECLRHSMEEKGDLYLVDIMLPGMSGHELGEKLFERYQDITIVYMSGKSDFRLKVDHPPNSRVYYISKPFKIKTLRLIIQCIINPDHPDCKDCDKENCPLRIE